MVQSYNNRILITGGAGFLGSAIAERCLSQNHDTHVTILDPAPPSSALIERYADRVEHCAFSIDDFVGAERSVSYSAVIHLAWANTPATSMAAPEQDVSKNLLSGIRLLEKCSEWNVGRFIFASSGGTVYGSLISDRADEAHPTAPISIYGASKLAFEHYARAIGASRGFSAISLRVANPYGAYQLRGTPIGSIANFILAAHRGDPITLFGSGDVIRDYIAIEDVASAFGLAISEVVPSGAYNIGSGRGVSLNDIIAILERVIGRPVLVHRRDARAFDVPRVVLDCRRFMTVTHWRPDEDLEAGIRRMWNSMLAA